MDFNSHDYCKQRDNRRRTGGFSGIRSGSRNRQRHRRGGFALGRVIERLSRCRTVISLDYSGAGDTVDDGLPLTLPKLARQVEAAAVAAGVDTFDLVGHSLGGAVAVTLASQRPDRVRSLTLVAGFLWGGAPRMRLLFELWRDLIQTNREAYVNCSH